MKLLAKNRRATFDYQIESKLVAGLVLTGAEVKSTKAGHASLRGAFIYLRDGEAYLTNALISPYASAGAQAVDSTRSRKLLLHRRELDTLQGHQQSGLTAIPLALLEDRGLVKVEVGLGRGQKKYDKRANIKRREAQREAARAVKR